MSALQSLGWRHYAVKPKLSWVWPRFRSHHQFYRVRGHSTSFQASTHHQRESCRALSASFMWIVVPRRPGYGSGACQRYLPFLLRNMYAPRPTDITFACQQPAELTYGVAAQELVKTDGVRLVGQIAMAKQAVRQAEQISLLVPLHSTLQLNQELSVPAKFCRPPWKLYTDLKVHVWSPLCVAVNALLNMFPRHEYEAIRICNVRSSRTCAIHHADTRYLSTGGSAKTGVWVQQRHATVDQAGD